MRPSRTKELAAQNDRRLSAIRDTEKQATKSTKVRVDLLISAWRTDNSLSLSR